MLTSGSIILAVIGLGVWVIRYLIARNDKNMVKSQNAIESVENVEKANNAISNLDDDKRDKLREHYNIK